MVQAKPAIPGITPGVNIPQSDQDVEPGFTPTTLPSTGPAITNVQAKSTVHGTEDERAGLSEWAPELNMLYDTTTGKPVRLEYQDIAPALMAGKVGFKKGESIPMIASNGESWNIPSENVNVALSQGYRLEHPKEIAVREFAAENKGITGSAKAFLTNFADEALFGVPGIVYQHEASDVEKAKLEALKKENPIANTVGGIAGFGASMFYGGELFQTATKGGRLAERAVLGTLTKGAEETAARAIAKEGEQLAVKTLTNKLVESGVSEATAQRIAPGLLRQTAANMAKYGVEGAVITAPGTITEAALGDEKAAAEHLAVGIGTGALLGTLGPLGRGFTKLTKNVIKLAPETISPAARVGKALGVESIDGAGQMLMDEGVINKGMSVNTIKTRLEDLKTRSYQDMDDIINKLDQAAVDDPALHALNQVSLTNTVKRLAELRTSVDEPLTRTERKAVDDILDTLVKRGPVDNEGSPIFKTWKAILEAGDKNQEFLIPTSDAMQVRNLLEKKTDFNAGVKDTVNGIKRQAYGIIRDEIDTAISKLGNSLADQTIAPAFEKASTNARMSEDISYLLHNKDLSKTGENVLGLSDLVLGGIGGVKAIASGHFAPLLLPILGNYGKKAFNSVYGQTALASLMYKAGLDRSGVLFAEQAMKYGAEQLDKLPEVLSKPLQKVSPSTVTLDAISRFLGKDTPATTMAQRQELFKELSKKINEVTLSPDQSATKISQLSAPIAVGGAPKLSRAYVEQIMKTYQYLQSVLPNADKTYTPFKKNITQLSDKQLSDFEHALRVVENPWYVIDSLSTGTTTQSEVDTLRAIYPNIYRDMVNKITEFAYSGQASTLPYETRLKLSLLMGIKLDQSVQNVNVYQNTFSMPSQKAPSGSNLKIAPAPKDNPYATPITKSLMR